ncbi:MAG: TlpA family protein disulfide reductase [Syntrophales bacterium]|nr:TlpA family protein disulfide reductase [Syntrophales bacterium]
MKRFKETVVLIAAMAALLLFPLGHAAGQTSIPDVGAVFPDLSPGFNLPRLQDGFVIIQIFSMYCPYCQREAPNVNKLYAMIEADPSLRNRVRLVGIGVGNTPYEVDTFRKRYQIRFPLYSDGDFRIHKKLGEPRTPHFFGVRINPDGSNRIFFSRLGEFGDPAAFLAEMVRLSGIKR